MIFLTVGTQLPFDRLIKAVDQWAAAKGRTDVFAQIGNNGWRPPHIQWAENLSFVEFKKKVEVADLVVAHAGIGAIQTAQDYGKPVLVMPRRAAFKEHRNDHQMDTAVRLAELGYIGMALDEEELLRKLDRPDLIPRGKESPFGTAPKLLKAIQDFIKYGF
jgi:UDP-N-acetylglucosamine transferase subunit ALG13